MTQTRTPDHPVHPVFVDRWSPRAFSDEAIPRTELLTLLEAARWAPSAFNAQPWRFVYALRQTSHWDRLLAALLPFNRAWAEHASALVVIASERTFVPAGKTEAQENRSAAFDSGAAWASLAFQAALTGWSTHAVAGFDEAAVRVATQLPESLSIHAVVVIGRRGDKNQLNEALQAREVPSPRRPLVEIAGEGVYSGSPQR